MLLFNNNSIRTSAHSPLVSNSSFFVCQECVLKLNLFSSVTLKNLKLSTTSAVWLMMR